jgi:hypothetical protein
MSNARAVNRRQIGQVSDDSRSGGLGLEAMRTVSVSLEVLSIRGPRFTEGFSVAFLSGSQSLSGSLPVPANG